MRNDRVELVKKVKLGLIKANSSLFALRFSLFFVPLHPLSRTFEHWRDGRVVDYSSLENYRAERHRGFESLSLRSKILKPADFQRVLFFFPFRDSV